MRFVYTEAIRKIRALKTRKKVIQGGTSAGKTFAILAVLIDKAIKNPESEISVVSESIPHLRRGALKDFLSIMKITNRFIPDNFNKTHLKYEFANGSYIEFFSVDDESKLRGARRTTLYINEGNNINFDSYLQLAIRTSGDIYIDFNPTHKFWAHTEVLNEQDSELLILTYKDNSGLPQSIVDELESNRVKSLTSDYWKNWCKVYLDGQIGSLEGVIFSNWNEIDRVPDNASLIGAGLDFGFTNDPSTMVAVYKIDDRIILDEIFYQKGLTNSDIANLIKSSQLNTVVYADSAEPKSIAEISKYGIKIVPAQKGKDSINFGISILQEYDILVTKRSYNLKDELVKYQWMKNKEGQSMNIPIDAFNHTIDAIRYLAIMKLKKINSTRTFRIG